MTRKSKDTIVYDDSNFSEDDEEFGEPGPVLNAIFDLFELIPRLLCFAFCALCCYVADVTISWIIFVVAIVGAVISFMAGVLIFFTWLADRSETVR